MTLRPWVLGMVLWAPVLAWSRPFEVCGVRVTIGDQRAVLEAAMSAGCRLRRGIRDFPTAEELAHERESHGFAEVDFERLSLGIVAIHTARKPPEGGNA